MKSFFACLCFLVLSLIVFVAVSQPHSLSTPAPANDVPPAASEVHADSTAATPPPVITKTALEVAKGSLVNARAELKDKNSALDAAKSHCLDTLHRTSAYREAFAIWKAASDTYYEPRDSRTMLQRGTDLTNARSFIANMEAQAIRNDNACRAAASDAAEASGAVAAAKASVEDEESKIAEAERVAEDQELAAGKVAETKSQLVSQPVTDNTAINQPNPIAVPSVDSAEHVGPRGGLYHYTANGKKVYDSH